MYKCGVTWGKVYGTSSSWAKQDDNVEYKCCFLRTIALCNLVNDEITYYTYICSPVKPHWSTYFGRPKKWCMFVHVLLPICGTGFCFAFVFCFVLIDFLLHLPHSPFGAASPHCWSHTYQCRNQSLCCSCCQWLTWYFAFWLSNYTISSYDLPGKF